MNRPKEEQLGQLEEVDQVNEYQEMHEPAGSHQHIC